jgi:hypothetical protein
MNLLAGGRNDTKKKFRRDTIPDVAPTCRIDVWSDVRDIFCVKECTIETHNKRRKIDR